MGRVGDQLAEGALGAVRCLVAMAVSPSSSRSGPSRAASTLARGPLGRPHPSRWKASGMPSPSWSRLLLGAAGGRPGCAVRRTTAASEGRDERADEDGELDVLVARGARRRRRARR